MKAFAPGDIPRLREVGIDVPTALFTSAVLVVVTLVVGLAPAVVATRMNGVEGGSRRADRPTAGRATRLRDVLTVMEIALAASLLVCAGLTLRSLHALVSVDLGFATGQRFAFKTNLTERGYPDAARVERFYEQLTDEARVAAGHVVHRRHLVSPAERRGPSVNAAPAGRDAGQTGDSPSAGASSAAATSRRWALRCCSGRLFSTDDRPGVPGRRDRGRRARAASVDDMKARPSAGRFASVRAHARRREPWSASSATSATSSRASNRCRCRLRAAVAGLSAWDVHRHQEHERATGGHVSGQGGARSVDPAVPMYFAETVAARYDSAISLPRFTAGLVSAFSTLALVLAGVGIFGVTGYAVAQRMREFGIRFALGAQRLHVGALVLGRVALLAGVGLTIGTGVGIGLGSLMSGILFGVEFERSLDDGFAIGAIGLTAILASLAPLRHAVA